MIPARDSPPPTFDAGDAVVERPGRTIRALLEDPLLNATWCRYAAGERGSDQHVHHQHVDAFLVLGGSLELRLGPSKTAHLAAGTFALVPPNLAHMFANPGGCPADFLNFHAPGMGFLSYLRGDNTNFDQRKPGADGGLSETHAIVTHIESVERRAEELVNDGDLTLGRHPAITATAISLDAGAHRQLPVEAAALSAYFVLRGEITVNVGEASSRARAGTWTCVRADGSGSLELIAGANPVHVFNVRVPCTPTGR